LDTEDPVVSLTPVERPVEADVEDPYPLEVPALQPEFVPVVLEVLLFTDELVLPLVPEEDPQLPPNPKGVTLPVELLPSDQPELVPEEVPEEVD